METPFLANVEPSSSWARLQTGAFTAHVRRPDSLAILSIYGVADHGLGLSLDIEEVIGSEILNRACVALRSGGGNPWMLPPLRVGPAPYPSQYFGVDPDQGLEWLREVSDGVRRSGFSQLVLVTTSPWHREWVDACALDLHAEKGLKVFKLHLSDIGLALHPTASMADRARTQAIGAALLQIQPGTASSGDVRDVDFRPGCFRQAPPVETPAGMTMPEVQNWLNRTSVRCARLWAEASGKPATIADNSGSQPGKIWRPYGRRYLPALTQLELNNLPDLAHAVAVIPVGAIEQHGPHLPVGVDSLLGQGLLAEALHQLPADAPIWVSLPISIGKSLEHQGFPGTLSISSRTLRALVTTQVEQLHALGFGTVAIWNTHGGNSAVLTYTIRELQTRLGLRIGRLESGFKPDLGPQENTFGFHAGQWETSLMLAMVPDLVNAFSTICDYPARLEDPGELRPERGTITHAWMTSDISSSGVMGDATAASEAQGQDWIKATSEALSVRLLELAMQ